MDDRLREFTGDPLHARVALALAPSPGDVLTAYMVSDNGPVGALRYAADFADCGLSGSDQLDAWGREIMTGFDADRTRAVLDEIEHEQVRLLTPDDLEWPARLDGHHASPVPLAVWAVGDLTRLQPDLSRPEVALLGTRSPSFPGTMAVTQLAADLAADGYRVTAGGTGGIGSATVEGTVTVGGQPLLVLPGRDSRPLAYRHDPVFEEAADTGAVVAELTAPDRSPAGQHASRDRLLLPLVDAVVLVETPDADPDLVTARTALGYGIGVGAVPGYSGAGGSRLVQDGLALPVSSTGDVDELLEHRDVHIDDARAHLTRTASVSELIR